jgi:ring-1,2-phenylacetyl-CoA epoxidase subunit PaaC
VKADSGPARDALHECLIALADDELILGHRDSEWTGHAPILEEDIAFSNLAQDEMGHALTWYTLARDLGAPDPDRLAFFRGASEFHNAVLLELPRGDWAFTIVRQYLFDAAEQARYTALLSSAYSPIAAAAAKLRSEETYHLMHSRGWVQRLVFEPTAGESLLVAERAKPAEETLRDHWLAQVTPVLEAATLRIPVDAQPVTGGRSGRHTQHLTALLHEMQKVARFEPEATW